MRHPQRQHGRWYLTVLSAVGLLAAGAGVALGSSLAGSPNQRSSNQAILYVAASRGGHEAPAAASRVGAAGTRQVGNCRVPSEPCATIADAVRQAPPDATILVEAGTYKIGPSAARSRITLSRPVTLEARGRVILTGAAPIFTVSGPARPQGAGRIVIRGFHFVGVTGAGGVIATSRRGASDLTIEGNTFARVKGSAIVLRGVGDSVVEGNTIAGAGDRGIVLTGRGIDVSANDRILGNRVADVPNADIVVGDSRGVLISGNDVTRVGSTCTRPGTDTSRGGCSSAMTSKGVAIVLEGARQVDILVTKNVASKSDLGLVVGAGVLGRRIDVTKNDFVNDSSAGVASAASGATPLNATRNWWGCRNGPAVVTTPASVVAAPSTCSRVGRNVNVLPVALKAFRAPILRKRHAASPGSSPPAVGATSPSTTSPPASTTTTSTTTTTTTSTTNTGGAGSQQCTSSPTGAIAYLYPAIVNSNGYNTYIDSDMWAANPGTTQTVCASNPGNWTSETNAGAGYTGVQTYPNVQQLFTDWDGRGWNKGPNMSATPISALKSLSSTYATTNPSVGDFEAAYDVWLENTPYTEVMIWVYNVNRGTGGVGVAGHTTLFGGPVTLLHDSGSNEIILSLDHNQASGTINILAALKYLQAQGLVAPTATLGQIDFGWEICNTAGQSLTFGVSGYSIKASS